MHVVDLAFALVASAMLVGAVVQGCVGFGMIVIAFPVLVVVEPALMPQTILVVSLPITLLNAFTNFGGAEYREVGWISLGRIPGLAGGLLLLGMADRSTLALGGGLVVLVAVALSVWAPRLPRNVPTMLAVGSISALFGTAIGIGGPPLGLLYQHETGQRLRSTISLVMLTGAPISLILLAAIGDLSRVDVQTGAALVPFAVVGSLLAPRFAPGFDDRIRKAVLSICAAAAVIAMARVLVG
ncbi:MAG: sulfite exporter TauE/SafE family protein [Actinomycetota bacterium]|nr:sulfite exporter TauE/SafE family protein [Actinomycetota bacterium]